jgi:serine/threonine protein kinase
MHGLDTIQVVIGDLGNVEIADPHFRLQKKLRLGDSDLYVCTLECRPPDVLLGSQQFQEDLDMWSFGCAAAEIYSRQILIAPPATAEQAHSPKQFVEAIAAIVPSLRNWSRPSCPASWLEELPFFKKWYACSGQAWLTARAETAKPWPPECLEGCPEGLAQLIQKCLVWHPSARMTVAEAKNNSFLQPPGKLPLQVLLAAQRGKNGVGTIAQADLDPDLLRYLQMCPSWNSLAKECLQTQAPISKCIAAEEAELRNNTEIPGFVDEENPPKCSSLNSDTNLQLIPSKRLAAFVRALRKKWRPWLQQLGGKMREAVRADGMPSAICQQNGQPFLQEDFADNAFAYASIQLMQPGARDDGWHTDGGCSLLHASVTLFGTRSVEVKVEGKPQVTLDQEPGSFYVGNLSALEHNVRHHEECKHTFDGAAVTAKGDGKDLASAATAKGDAEDPAPAETAKGDQRRQIAVMIRSDVFRNFRARKINSTPGPVEFFRVVNRIVAQHLADVPVALPDLTEVLAEVARTAKSNMALTS